MTTEVAIQRARILQAWANGAKIQYRLLGQGDDETAWKDAQEPTFNWKDYEWRIKPVTPAPDDFYICVTHNKEVINYAVLPHKQAALNYPCQEILFVKVVDRLPGKES